VVGGFRLNFFKKIDEHFEEYILSTLLMSIGIVMLIQVILRYVFKSPLSWAEEVCRYMFVWSAFMSIGYCFKKEKVLIVDALYVKFPKALKNIMDIISAILTLIFFSFLFIRSISIVQAIASSGQVSSALGIPMKYVYMAAPVGLGIGVLRYLQSIPNKIRRIKRGDTQ
jgi:TRAP-type C4-dicarboxylate transport system permease small subunit